MGRIEYEGKKKRREESPLSSTSISESSDSSSERNRRRRRRRREKEKKRDKYDKRKKRQEEEKERDRARRRRKRDKINKHKSSKDKNNESSSGSDSPFGSPPREASGSSPEHVLSEMLDEFPQVGGELILLLEMIDNGQAVDIKGISEKSLVQYLKRLFTSLHLKENGDSVFVLPAKARPTVKLVRSLIHNHSTSKEQPHRSSNTTTAPEGSHSTSTDELKAKTVSVDNIGSRRRVIGPEMPSAELLAAAARLTEAQAELKEIELEEDNELFVGPPPPAMVAESETANDAERFEEVTRIMDADSSSPYDVIGGNENMSIDKIKKRYWKLSLLVHPDKCSHPLAHQAFVKLNTAFKELQDPEKKNSLDEKIKMEKEREQFKIELKAMQEAAQWRRSQGISMEGDDDLLAQMEVKDEKKRDEWMTTLPPERKPGMTMQSSRFSKSSVEGRGDCSVWTDTPSDRAQKAKTNYLEAFNDTATIADHEQRNQRNGDAELVDEYNRKKRSKSLLQKHKEGASNNSKKIKTSQENAEWVGQHPWKPWDREKDLSAGRLSAKLDTENMGQGLSSRFSSGNFQRNFL